MKSPHHDVAILCRRLPGGSVVESLLLHPNPLRGEPEKRDASSRSLLRAVLPVDPLDGMRRPVGAHCFAESREESLFPETCEESETLHLVLDRILHLGETQLDVSSVE